eukprot:6179386-Pleurochrysis_carterae.AAC.5
MLLVTPGLAPFLQTLANLRCQHTTHTHMAGGSKTNSGWASRQHSAYPPYLNFFLARVIATHLQTNTPPFRQSESQAAKTQFQPTTEPSPATITTPTVAMPLASPTLPAQPTPEADLSTRQNEESQLRRSFKRTLGPYPLRSRGAALLALRTRSEKPTWGWGRNTGCAFAASSASTDPSMEYIHQLTNCLNLIGPSLFSLVGPKVADSPSCEYEQ